MSAGGLAKYGNGWQAVSGRKTHIAFKGVNLFSDATLRMAARLQDGGRGVGWRQDKNLGRLTSRERSAVWVIPSCVYTVEDAIAEDFDASAMRGPEEGCSTYGACLANDSQCGCHDLGETRGGLKPALYLSCCGWHNQIRCVTDVISD